MTEPIKIQKVISKIQRLRKIASSTHSRAEQETAFSIAAKLIAENQLSEIELQIKENSVEGIELDQEHIIYEAGRSSPWKAELVWGLAKINGLFAFVSTIRHPITHKNGRRYRVIGRLSDIQVAIYMFEYLTETIQELSDKEFPHNFKVDGYGTLVMKRGVNPEKESYCLGCVYGFVAKMEKESTEVMRQASSQAMVLISNKAKEAEQAYLSKTKMKMHSLPPSKAQRDSDALNRGYVKGQTLSVDKGLEK